LENISNLIASLTSYTFKKNNVNLKFSEFCYDMHHITDFKFKLNKLDFPTRIEIIHGSHSLYPC